jgi:hypothetical protein
MESCLISSGRMQDEWVRLPMRSLQSVYGNCSDNSIAHCHDHSSGEIKYCSEVKIKWFSEEQMSIEH